MKILQIDQTIITHQIQKLFQNQWILHEVNLFSSKLIYMQVEMLMFFMGVPIGHNFVLPLLAIFPKRKGAKRGRGWSTNSLGWGGEWR